jgi:glyoxylase I family protein
MEHDMLRIETLHHVSLPVTDLERSKAFYRDVLELKEIARPPFDFPGAWYQLGDRQLHLIVGQNSTFRVGKGIDSRDIHFAVQVPSYRRAVEHFESKGYRTDSRDEVRRLRLNPSGRAGVPQIHILDPDRNVIEINAERLD